MRRPHAEAEGIKSRLGPRKWIEHQVRDRLHGPNCEHADLIGEISVASSKVSHRVGRRRLQLYVTPSTAKDTSGLWRIFCMRRMRRNRWELVPSANIQQHDYPNLRIFCSVAPRKIGRARRRWQRASTPLISEEQRPITLVYDMVPDLRQRSLSLRPPTG